MSFFGSKLFGLSSNGAGPIQSTSSSSISGAETIERLCERVQSSLLVEDRKDSLNAIKTLSKKYKLEVGTQAMPLLIDILKNNRMDSELCCLALDILLNVMKTTTSDSSEQHEQHLSHQNLPVDISIQFSEMFIKDLSNLTLLFELIDEFDFQTRWSTLKLLNQLIVNLESLSQEKILQVPRGVSRLIDMLSDSREVIRNDAIILLINLTKTNGNIQKIVAFESGFDRIMEIIDSEGNVLRGGIIVEDCLNLLINLLQGNSSNQSFFKEANFIKVICKYLDLSEGEAENNSVGGGETTSSTTSGSWSAQKCKNLSLLLKLIRCLVSPSNQQHVITDSQKAFSHFGLLHRLCALLTMPGVPADTLGEAIKTVGEVIRGDSSNQQLFSNVIMQANPPRSLVTILLFSMINDKQPFQLRNSILYCFECYLHKNEEKKREIIETLLPRESAAGGGAGDTTIKSGQILCNGLFNPTDSISNWLCAVALAHTINESVQLKEQLLRVQLAVNSNPSGSGGGGEIRAVSLMEQCMMSLIESRQLSASVANSSVGAELSRFQTTIAILMLMATWLVDSPAAVNMFLAQQQNIPYLISQASSTETDEKSQIIQGICSFLLGLSLLFNSDQVPMYTIEKLKDIIKKRIGIEQFEHKLEFISQHEAYTKTLKLTAVTFKSLKPADLLFDYEFARLFKSNETIILNALRKNTITPHVPMINSHQQQQQQHQHQQQQINSHRNYDTSEWEQQITEYRKIIRELDGKLGEERQLNQNMAQTCAQLQQSIYQLQMQQQHASALAATAYEQQEWLTERLRLQAKMGELEVKVNLLEEKCSEQEDEICKLQREKGNLQETLVNLQATASAKKSMSSVNAATTSELEAENKSLRTANAQLSQEQESLLTLLSEMELKIKRYRRMLRDRGETNLTDNEDDDEEEEEEEEKAEEYKTANTAAVEQARKSVSESHQEPSSPLLANLDDNNSSFNTYPTIIPAAAVITTNGLDQQTTAAAANTNPIFDATNNYISSFSNSFAQQLNFEQPAQQSELQNYFK